MGFASWDDDESKWKQVWGIAKKGSPQEPGMSSWNDSQANVSSTYASLLLFHQQTHPNTPLPFSPALQMARCPMLAAGLLLHGRQGRRYEAGCANHGSDCNLDLYAGSFGLPTISFPYSWEPCIANKP